MTDNNAVLSGEQKLRKRRHAFWRYAVLAFIASLVLGLLLGSATSAFRDGTIPVWVPIAAIILTIVGLLWFTWDYFRRIDELDLMDNLWSHLAGFYGGLFIFGGWYWLGEIELTGYPTVGPILAAMLIITFVVYGLRKLGLR